MRDLIQHEVDSANAKMPRVQPLTGDTVDDDRLLPRALEIARTIAANSAFGVWMTKRGAWANMGGAGLRAAIELEGRTQILTRTTGELAKAAQALLSRRKHRERPDNE